MGADMQLSILVIFIIYFLAMIAIGLHFYRRASHIDDYFLGGRSLGRWVAAISAQASDMSGWLLMGLPGAVYLGGGPAVWIAAGLLIGTYVNWKVVALRLRVYTQVTDSLTLSIFFENRFRDPSGLLRTVTALITLVFFTIYVSSGLVASGKLFQEVFGINYALAVACGAGVIVIYTCLGGFLAVSWTDLVQGMLMIIGIVVAPSVSFYAAGGFEGISRAMAASGAPTGLLPVKGVPVLVIISAMAWGLGYFGQPHILARFMGIKSPEKIPQARRIAVGWVFISLLGAIAVGFIAMPLFPGLSGGNEEKVFIYMVGRVFNPLVAGVLLAAILSAIMSTIDSQLLVCSSNITEDFYLKMIRKNAPDRELVHLGRFSVFLISLGALVLALDPGNTVLGVVAYAWGGFGAAFGPVVLFALFSRATTWRSALGGMITGTVVLVAWKQLKLDAVMYEIVPGFIANACVIMLINYIIPQKDGEILKEYDMVLARVHGVPGTKNS